MRHRLTILLLLMLPAIFGGRVKAALTVPLTIQEAVFPGSVAGVARASEPVTAGIPLPDDASNGATNVSELGLTGASVGQFRVLGRWPSGRIKWVLVDTQASLAAGARNMSVALTTSGSGNFGGPDLATDNGSTITVSTGAATFVIRKAFFNGFDQVVVNGTTVVAAGTSQGLSVMGPAPGQTACGTCATLYSSSNDATSTAVIEENGPARTVIKATGSHKDTSGNSYMRFTVRMHFYKGKSAVKAVTSLRNAELGPSNSFATAYKGFEAFEWRLGLNLAGTTEYAFGTHAADATGTFGAADTAYIYQGKSGSMQNLTPSPDYTSDTGYSVVRNGSTVASGTTNQLSAGWGNVQTVGGAGVLVGHYFPAAYYPKSIVFNGGGTDTRVGIWPAESSAPFYQAWPQHSTHDVFFQFHDAALPSNANAFLALQHKLLARAALTHYNASAVFPTPFADAATEDSYYVSVQSAAVPALSAGRGCCISDLGTANVALWPLSTYREYSWPGSGPMNQPDRHWSYLMQWLIRGMPGRYLDGAHFERYMSDFALPRSDGFTWRSQSGAYGFAGQPTATSLNNANSYRSGPQWANDLLHEHWWGIGDYYFLSGDEAIKDLLIDDALDHLIAPGIWAQIGYLPATRSVGNYLLLSARIAGFLDAVGEPASAAAVSSLGQTVFEKQVKSDLCVSETPSAMSVCNPSFNPNNVTTWRDGTTVNPGARDGTSRTRGVHQPDSQTSTEACGGAGIRLANAFMTSILVQGLLEYSDYRGPGWADYWQARDLMYGNVQFRDNELFKTVGRGRFDEDGIRPGLCLDYPNGNEPNWTTPTSGQTFAPAFYANWAINGGNMAGWSDKFKIAVQRVMSTDGPAGAVDHSGAQWNAVIYRLTNPSSISLQNVPITSVTNNGGGSYTIQWNVPAGAVSYRVKYGNKQIVDWIGFDPATNTFLGNPATTMNWFAATNASSIPSPGSVGSTQSMTISTGLGTALTAANFSVKAYVQGAAGSWTPPPPAPRAPAAPTNVRFFGIAASNPSGPASSVPWTMPSGGTAAANWSRAPVSSGWLAHKGFLNLWFDQVSQQMLLYGVVSASTSIYSSDVFTYSPRTNSWTHVGGNGTLQSACGASTTTWPGDRHPESMMAVDTRRNVWWLWSGVCFGTNRQDLWYMTLNSDPMQNRWTRVTPARLPIPGNSAAMVYDPDDDVLFLFGSDGSSQTHDNWVYCPTWATATPGTLSASQRAAGCTLPDNWSEVTVAGGVQPPGVAFSAMVYDTVSKKVIQYGGQTGGGVVQNQTWAYDVPTKTWQRKALSTTAPPVYAGSAAPVPAIAYNPLSGKVLFHQTNGGPKDWQYDPVGDTWTELTSSGGGPTADMYMTFDPLTQRLISFSKHPSTGATDVWHGVVR